MAMEVSAISKIGLIGGDVVSQNNGLDWWGPGRGVLATPARLAWLQTGSSRFNSAAQPGRESGASRPSAEAAYCFTSLVLWGVSSD